MTLLEQCQIWTENEEYQKIIDTLEGLPDEERTPETDSELARAYNNAADVEDRALFEKAIGLLKPHEEYFKGDHRWNFRMAYAYYFLNQEFRALHYFEQALKARPGDEDTLEMIDRCHKNLAFPRFEKDFRKRTAEAWAAFEWEESRLRQMLDQKDRGSAAEEMMDKCSDALKLAFSNPAFELGRGGEKYELILSAEGNQARLFELVYFQSHAPADILEHWNIRVGRQPSRGFRLRQDGWEISEQDVQVQVRRQGDHTVTLTLFCEKLLPLLRENENKAWWLLTLLVDQVLGEVASIALVSRFEVTDEPLKEEAVCLENLPDLLKQMGLDTDQTAREYLDNCYTGYQWEPEEDPNADWRMDAYVGSTRCIPLLNDYFNNENIVMDAFHADGVAAGFFCYPLDSFDGEERGAAILDFRDALEAAVTKRAGEDAVTFLGGATGIYCGYLDFIAWDLPAVLDAAAEFFQESPLSWAGFHSFRREADVIYLLDRKSKE